MPVFQLTKDLVFPPVELAESDGLLAVGGDLCEERLLAAYEEGIFPWYAQGDPILWWSPDPRLVVFPKDLHVSKSMRKFLRKTDLVVTMDTAFADVIRFCGEIRVARGEETWLTPEMRSAYCHLHETGYAHSVETWTADGQLVGGLYGVSIGRAFFGESMFARRSNASKMAFIRMVRQLADWDFDLIDCQVETEHLGSMGAVAISRNRFVDILRSSIRHPTRVGCWQFD